MRSWPTTWASFDGSGAGGLPDVYGQNGRRAVALLERACNTPYMKKVIRGRENDGGRVYAYWNSGVKPGRMTYNEAMKFWVSNVDDYDFKIEYLKFEEGPHSEILSNNYVAYKVDDLDAYADPRRRR